MITHRQVNLSIEYTPGDASRTQMLKEAGLTWADYAKAMLSLEEFIILINKVRSEGKKLVYKDNYYKHHSKRLALRKKYYKKRKEEVTNLTDTPVMCKCGDLRKDHYDNWGDYTGCSNKLNCGCSEFVLKT